MKTSQAIQFLQFLQASRMPFFTSTDVRIWSGTSKNTASQAIKRHLKSGLFMRVSRGLYASALGNPFTCAAIPVESIVTWLRPGHFSYSSLESRLSDLGVISQIPFRFTCMTTGRSGVEDTPYGIVEFTHFKNAHGRRVFWNEAIGAWEASPLQAWIDLQALQRNTGLIDQEYFEELLESSEKKEYLRLSKERKYEQ